MDRQRFQLIDRLFHEALACSERERADFLARACGSDAELRREVDALLACDARPRDTLESAAPALQSALAADHSADPLLGTTVGAYQLERVIGRGGMGTVYLGFRADRQFHKQVAVKVVKRGMDSDEILKRFVNERQTLAHLDHPNIARLLDGGTTDQGLPFLVMEYIDGLPIDRFCDQRCLSTVARLELFGQVCEGVQYAHQNLVVHRDIKPSNVLVTEQGGVKLLDFGVAKLLGPDAALNSGTLSRDAGRFFTPEYASPEQVKGLAMSTASDVYSLGVVLYELLTGHRPYDLGTRSGRSIEDIICEQEPLRPSTAVGRVIRRPTAGGARTITPEAVSRLRDGRPEKLRRRLTGDLDNIVLMALRKEPERRYRSVEQFSGDIRRHIEGRPVTARRDTFLYRGSKFLKRNRGLAAAGLLLVVFLVGGILSTTWQARRATGQAHAARRVRTFLADLVKNFDPMNGGNSRLTVPQFLDETALSITAQLQQQPLEKISFMHTVAELYENFSLYDDAARWRQESLRLERRTSARTAHDVANSLHGLGWALHLAGRDQAAKPHLEEALLVRRKLHDQAHPELASSLNALAVVHRAEGRFEAAERLFGEALAMRRRIFATPHQDVIESLAEMGRFQQGNMDYASAERLLEEARHLAGLLPAENRAVLAGVYRKLADLYHETQRHDEAEQAIRKSLAIVKSRYGLEHPRTARILTDLARIMATRYQHLGAVGDRGPLDLCRQALDIQSRLFRKPHHDEARTHLVLGQILAPRTGEEVSQTAARRALQVHRQLFPPGHAQLADPLTLWGENLVIHGDAASAQALVREAHHIRQRRLPPNHWKISETEGAIGYVLVGTGAFDEAAELLTVAYRDIEAARGPFAPETDEALRRLVILHTAAGNHDQAEQHARLLESNHRRRPAVIVSDCDFTQESAAFVDYDDDFFEKTVVVDPRNLEQAAAAYLWIYGRPSNYEGQPFSRRRDFMLVVNGPRPSTAEPLDYPNLPRTVTFDVGLAFDGLTAVHHWVPFPLPVEWLQPGENTFLITKWSPQGAWDHNNFYIGIDLDHDQDRSWWYGGTVFDCYEPSTRAADPSSCDGELMMFLELQTTNAPAGGDPPILVASRLHLARQMRGVAASLLGHEKPAAAERLLRASIAIYERCGAADLIPITNSALGLCLARQGRYEKAESLLLSSYRHLRLGRGDRNPSTQNAVQNIIELYEHWAKPDLAAEYRSRLPHDLPRPEP